MDSHLDPIAAVFENTLVMFVDIEGYPTWCLDGEPTQVFLFLEMVYRDFDIEASKLAVFKVKTVGNRYVAVTKFLDERENLNHFADLTIDNGKDIIACNFYPSKIFLFIDLEYVGRVYPNIF